MILAHETWFVSQHPQEDWGFATSGATLALLAGAVAITLAVRLVSHFWNGVDVPFLARLAPWMPFALRMHLAVSLIGLLSMGVYLSPAMDLDGSFGSVLLGAGMVVVAVSMASGYRVREASWLLVAFQEKLANPRLALDFLQAKPDFNVANSLLGLDWTDVRFVRVAGAIEVLFGLLLISGRLPQVIVIAAGIPFNATLFYFGTPELVGHLPIYGTMLVLLVFGSHPELRRAVGAIRPPSEMRHGRRPRSAEHP